VENAIEISYRAIEENPGKRIFLLSEMIHNSEVNRDLQNRGVKFIMDTNGNRYVEWEELKKDDIVIIPAFGTTVEIEEKLAGLGIDTLKYNTTCPFVEKVWNRADSLGKTDFTIIVHGKFRHEETRATFSHAKESAPTLIVRDLEEANILGKFMLGEIPIGEFQKTFEHRISTDFDPLIHLDRIGVVNQTTMLATETQAIADHLKNVMVQKFGENSIKDHFADTRDTLCYATHDNQRATYALLEKDADLALVVGGYNSSNTSHIVELCEEKLPTFFISSSEKILSKYLISHFHNPESNVSIDSAKDFLELTKIKLEANETGLFMVGGGVPKNFAQDTVVAAEILDKEVPMHKYAIQITVADDRDGALSGSTLKEASSWGKVDMTYEQMVDCNAAYCGVWISQGKLEKPN